MQARMRIPQLLSFAIPKRQTRWVGILIGAFALLAALAAATLSAQTPAAPAEHFVVVLDAAHGGEDPGARLGSEAEKAYTLAFSVRLRSLLMARGLAVVTTRESDATMDADHRAEIANHANAHACLSLHASESGSGVHVFVSSLAPAQPALFLPWKAAQAVSITRSLGLAGVLNSALTQAGMTVTLGRIGLPTIDSMTCPAVAVEIAPERSSDGSVSAGLDDPDYQARVAKALAAALVEWRSQEGGGKQP